MFAQIGSLFGKSLFKLKLKRANLDLNLKVILNRNLNSHWPKLQLTVFDDELEFRVRQRVGKLSRVVDPSVELPEVRQRGVPHPDHQVFVLKKTKMLFHFKHTKKLVRLNKNKQIHTFSTRAKCSFAKCSFIQIDDLQTIIQ